jgi:hypothetical protein
MLGRKNLDTMIAAMSQRPVNRVNGKVNSLACIVQLGGRRRGHSSTVAVHDMGERQGSRVERRRAARRERAIGELPREGAAGGGRPARPLLIWGDAFRPEQSLVYLLVYAHRYT